jgi:hypothetical protein
LECKTRHEESYLYPKLPHTYVPNISLTPPRLEINRSRPKRLTPPRSRSGSVVVDVAARMLGLERKLTSAQARW